MKRPNALIQEVCDSILEYVKSGKIVLVIGVTTSKKGYRYRYCIQNMRPFPHGVNRIYAGFSEKDFNQLKKWMLEFERLGWCEVTFSDINPGTMIIKQYVKEDETNDN